MAESKFKVMSVSLPADTTEYSYTSSGFGTPNGALVFATRATADGSYADHSMMCVGMAVNGAWQGMGSIDLDNQATTSVNRAQNTGSCILFKADKTIVLHSLNIITDGVKIVCDAAMDVSVKIIIVLIKAKNVTIGQTLLDQAENATKSITVGHPTSFFIGTSLFVTVSGTNSSSTYARNYFGICDSDLTQGSINNSSQGSQADSNVATAIYNNRFISRLDTSSYFTVTAKDATTITLTKKDSAANVGLYWMAVELETGENAELLEVTAPASTGNSSVTGASATPFFVLMGNTCCTAVNTVYDGDTTTNGGFGFSAFTTTDQYAVSAGARDEQATSDTRSIIDAKAVRVMSKGGTTNNIAEYVSMDSNGFTLNWTTLGVASTKHMALVLSRTSTAINDEKCICRGLERGIERGFE